MGKVNLALKTRKKTPPNFQILFQKASFDKTSSVCDSRVHTGRQLYVTAGSLHTALLSLLDPFVTSELMLLQPSAEMYTHTERRAHTQSLHRSHSDVEMKKKTKKKHHFRRVECVHDQIVAVCYYWWNDRPRFTQQAINAFHACTHTCPYAPTQTHTGVHGAHTHPHTCKRSVWVMC